MGEIRIIEKPDWVTFDDIHLVLEQAHSVHHENGFVMITSHLTGEQLEKRIGEKGKCWVALDGKKIVGTISVRFVPRNTWYASGEIPDYMLAGVIPAYQGKGINSMLAQKVFDFAKEQGCSLIELDTAENNTHAIDIYAHQGFRLVSFQAKKNIDHYSVVMVKWLGDCPYSEQYCRRRYQLRRFLIRMRFKVGRIKRFGI